jgi:hypothetical protein
MRILAVSHTERVLCGIVRREGLIPQQVQAVLALGANQEGGVALKAALLATVDGILAF